jgi:undecaprenyl-diphosphatase
VSTVQEVIARQHSAAAWARLHLRPPSTPTRFLRRYRLIVPIILGVIVFLALGAAIQSGALLRIWDEPVQKAVEETRTPTLNGVMHAVTHLGGHAAAFALPLLLIALVWRRCKSTAMVLVVATLGRPLVETVIKYLADRPRPDFERLVPGNGPSFPSGHVLAAVALWGLLPLIVGLLTNRKFIWWCSVAVSVTVVVAVAASRVYLGVHWFSDVLGGLLVGSLYLMAVERVLDWHHRRRPCAVHELHAHDAEHDLADAA